MKTASKAFLGLSVVLVMAFLARAEKKEESKEVTLKGTIVCAKCELKETDKCTNAIKVKKDDKEIVYYFDDKGGKESYHKNICREPKKGSVKGIVTKKDDKMYIKPSKDGVKFED
jgi:hypothetical protein